MERLIGESQQRNCSVYSVMRHTDAQAMFGSRTRESIVSFLELIDRTRALLEEDEWGSLAQWAKRFLSETGYIEELRRTEKNREAADNRVRNVEDLVETLDGSSDAALKRVDRLQSFLEDLALDSERQEEKDLQRDAVTLIMEPPLSGGLFPSLVSAR